MSRASFIRSILGYPRTVSRTPIAAMVRTVSMMTGIDVDKIHSKKRDHPTAWARQDVFNRASIEGYSQSETARYFGAHPTTVRHGIKAHKRRNTSHGETA